MNACQANNHPGVGEWQTMFLNNDVAAGPRRPLQLKSFYSLASDLGVGVIQKLSRVG